LLQEEAQISLPPLKFFEHEITERFAADKKIKIDLAKASDAIKTNGVILNSLSEAIITGDVRTDGTFWYSIPGVVSEVSSGVLLLLILNTCYLLFRVRKLSITVMVLQNNMLKTHSAQPLAFNYFSQISSKSNESWTTDPDSPLHTVIVQTTEKIWPYLLVCFVGVALMMAVCYKIWKRMCKRLDLNLQFSMMLEFSSNQRSVFVKVMELFGQPQDFRITAEDFIRDIKVEGCIFPKLKFIWETVNINDRVTQENFKIKTSHALTWRHARALRAKLSRPYIVLPVFVRNGQMMRIEVVDLTAPPLQRGKSFRADPLPHA